MDQQQCLTILLRHGGHYQATDDIGKFAAEFLPREIPDTESDPGVAGHDAVQTAFKGRVAHNLKYLRIDAAVFKGFARLTRNGSGYG